MINKIAFWFWGLFTGIFVCPFFWIWISPH